MRYKKFKLFLLTTSLVLIASQGVLAVSADRIFGGVQEFALKIPFYEQGITLLLLFAISMMMWGAGAEKMAKSSKFGKSSKNAITLSVFALSLASTIGGYSLIQANGLTLTQPGILRSAIGVLFLIVIGYKFVSIFKTNGKWTQMSLFFSSLGVVFGYWLLGKVFSDSSPAWPDTFGEGLGVFIVIVYFIAWGFMLLSVLRFLGGNLSGKDWNIAKDVGAGAAGVGGGIIGGAVGGAKRGYDWAKGKVKEKKKDKKKRQKKEKKEVKKIVKWSKKDLKVIIKDLKKIKNELQKISNSDSKKNGKAIDKIKQLMSEAWANSKLITNMAEELKKIIKQNSDLSFLSGELKTIRVLEKEILVAIREIINWLKIIGENNKKAEIQFEISEKETDDNKKEISRELGKKHLEDVATYLPHLPPLLEKLGPTAEKLVALEQDVRNKINDHIDSKK